ncbi:HPr kinase/phosphorylase [Meridianimarinicoccus aquatilis]|uniref:Serine kinase n=1 Tax=Meridianimarinicoccus aquatilis TaxID=2552766 RepID=A0A4R6B0I9_9RHOB|nr:serine kinase [Fluviibacterium aquatile]TDL90631.1 serine kinase [Fluviibacterium aquatile]
MANSQASEIRHATTVAVAGCGLMIQGPSGAGKSALALVLMAHGGQLVADDRTALHVRGTPARVWVDAPPGLPPLIEARGMGLLPAKHSGPVPLVALVRLDRPETDRLPQIRSELVLGHKVALFHNPENAHFPYALLQYLRCRNKSGHTHGG